MNARKGRKLKPEENKRVQAALEKLLKTQTQEELAEKINFRQTQISSVKSGRSGASPWFAMAIAKELGIPVSDLIEMTIEITPVAMPELSVRDFLEWLYKTSGLMAAVDRHRDVTIQDLFRLRESPARGGEADPTQIYEHILQLRYGPIGETVPHDIVEPQDLLRLLPPAPTEPPAETPGPKRRRRRTP
jgi:transcriptional regulator with XRE-family HTH domain